MTKIVFVDTETTSLRPDRRAWDIALVVREADGTETEHQWFVDLADLDLSNADLVSLRIGRFHERHPQVRPGTPPPAQPGPLTSRLHYRSSDWPVTSERATMHHIEQLTRGAHLVGNVIAFDAEVLAARMRAHGVLPAWHYHTIDVEPMAIGYLHGLYADSDDLPAVLGQLPWDSDELTRRLGLPSMPEAERHTALGDARWARDMYDTVIGASKRTAAPTVGADSDDGRPEQ